MPTFSPTSTQGRTGTIQSWTVPASGTYRIEARGAKGADGNNGGTTRNLGGKGARIIGDFSLTAGHVIKILVGQEGKTDWITDSGGGGGGGSFVYNQTAATLLIAAGGGGGGSDDANSEGGPGSATTSATASVGGTVTGANTSVGSGGTGNSAGGGAGWNSNGDGGTYGGTAFRFLDPTNPGLGGAGLSAVYEGGFGGGGGGGGTSGDNGGGGGGYTGGHGGPIDGAGGGGGSYNGGANQSNTAGYQTGAGLVEITSLNSPPVATVTFPAASSKHDPRLPINVAWTYSDADGNPQTQWEVGWKLASNSIYTTIGSGVNANSSFSIPANTLPDESDIDISVRVHDGSVWSATVVRRIRSDSWTYGSEVTTATQSVDAGPFGTSGDYQAQVRTADTTGFGPWSSSITFTAAETLAGNVNLGHANNVKARGPIGYWRLGEDSGTVVNDSSGNGVNLTYRGSVERVPGALKFSDDGAVRINDASEIISGTGPVFAGGKLSVEAWVKLDDLGSNRQTVVSWNEDTDGIAGLVLAARFDSNPNDVAVWFYIDGGWRQVNAPRGVGVGQWFHLAATYDGTAIRLYVNGSLVTSTPYVGSGALGALTGREIAIGGRSTYDIHNLFGSVDEVAIYSKALTAAEIADSYQSGLKTPEVTLTAPAPTTGVGKSVYDNIAFRDFQEVQASLGPAAHWRLGETSGANAIDEISGLSAPYKAGSISAESLLASDSNPARIPGATGVAYWTGNPLSLGLTGYSESVAVLIDMPDAPARGHFVKVGKQNLGDGYGIGVGAGDSVENAGTQLTVLYEMKRWINTGVSLTPGKHRIVLVIDDSGFPLVYLDGTLVYSDTAGPPNAPTTGVGIGSADSNLRPLSANVAVDEVGLFAYSLTAAEVKEDYYAAMVGKVVNLDAPAPVITAENVVWNNAAAEPVENIIVTDAELTGGSGGMSWEWSGDTVYTSGGYKGGQYRRLTANSSGILGGIYVWSTGKVKPGKLHTLTYRLRGSRSGPTWRVSAEWRRADGSITAIDDNIGVTAAKAGEWVEVGGTALAPADATGVTFCMYVGNATGTVAGDTFDFDVPFAAQSDVAIPYFDGDTVEGAENLALGKSVTITQGTLIGGSPRPPEAVTDGSTSMGGYLDVIDGPAHVTVDLGEVKTIDEVRVWHYYDGRLYNDTKTQVSRDGVTWITVFDSRTEGEYTEQPTGKIHNFAPTGVRYIRDWLNGSTANESNHWIEIQAYHRSANTLTYSWNGTPNASTSTRRKTLASNLYMPHPHVGAAYEIDAVPPLMGLMLFNGGPITIYWNGLFAVPGALALDAVAPTTTVYIRPITPTYTDEDYRRKFTEGFTRITRRVEILEANGQTLWDDKAGNESRLIGGSVSVDYTRNERRSADIELANFDRALVHKPGGFWYDKTLRLYRGIQFYDASGLREYEVPVGTFMIDRVSEARFPRVVKVTARDFTKKCLLSKFTQATAFEANETVEDVIGTLAANAGVNKRVLPTTGKTLGITYTFERGKTRWDAMKEIATAFGYELFFDTQGYLVMRKFLDPTLSPVSHEFITGPTTGNLVDWERSANDTRIFNHISVIGADTDTVPVWADARNENPLSPTNIQTLGDRVDTYESALVTTFEQAEELAETFLKIAALEEYEINMQSIVYPWLEAGEIVRFRDPERASDDEPDRFLLTSFDVPMGLSPMSAVGRRVTIVS